MEDSGALDQVCGAARAPNPRGEGSILQRSRNLDEKVGKAHKKCQTGRSSRPPRSSPLAPRLSPRSARPQMRAVRCLLALLALAGVAAFGGAEKQEVTQEVKAVVEKVRDAFDEAANAQGMNRMKGASRFEPVDVRAQFCAPDLRLQNCGLYSSAASLCLTTSRLANRARSPA